MPSTPGAAMSDQKLFIVSTTAPSLDVYERFWDGDVWLAAHRRFNALGTCDNAFTDQLGVTGER